MDNVMSIGEKIKMDLVPAAISGLISLGVYTMVFGEQLSGDYIPFLGKSLPASVVVGGTVFGSHLIGNILENNVLTMFQSEKLAGIEGRLAKPLISGAATVGIFKLAVSPDSNLMESFALGAGSVFVGQYVSDTFLGARN